MFVFIAFWLENSLHFELSKYFGLKMGFSLRNISFFLLLLNWVYTVKKRNLLIHLNDINKYIILSVIVVTCWLGWGLLGFNKNSIPLISEMVVVKEILNPWLYYFLIYHVINDIKTCRWSIVYLIVLMSLTIFPMILESYLGFSFSTSQMEGRAAGFSEPNQFAGFLVLVLPLLFVPALLKEKLEEKTIYTAVFLLGFVGLIATLSRGGTIAFLVSVMFFFLYSLRSKLLSAKWVIVLIMLVSINGSVAYYWAPSELKDTAERKFDLKQEREMIIHSERSWSYRITAGRTEIWLQYLKLYLEKPLLGFGNGQAIRILRVSSHNEYLKWLVNYGAVGLVLYVMIYFQIFRSINYRLKQSTDPQSRILYLSYLTGFVGYLTAIMAVNMGPPRYIFWIYTAVVHKFSQLEAGNQR